jgi:hypothetical protein
MSDRYWVGGGDGLWSATAGTKWATTSGGAGGSAVPTAADDVYFDALSPACTISANAVARSVDCTGYTNTLTHNAVSLSIGTSTVKAANIALKLVSGMTYTILGITSSISFVGTNATAQTVDFGGKTTGNLTFSGTTGKWTVTSAITATGATLTYSSSSTAVLDLNGQTCSFATFTGTTGTTKTLTLGAAAITMTGNWTFRGTVTANTATVTQTGAAAIFDNSGTSGANYNGMSLVQSGSGTSNFASGAGGAVTLANYTRTGTAVKTDGVTVGVSATITITGTLTLGGNTTQGVNRLFVSSNTLGALATIVATGAAVVISGDVDFMDIAITGSPSWTNSGSKYVGDALGNGSLITTNRTAPSTRYKIAGGGWATSTVWAASSGGTTDNRVPLPQDNMVFDGNSGGGTHTIDMPRSGADFTMVSGFVGTFAATNAASWYGSWTFVSGASTPTGSGVQTLSGRGTHTITTAGKTITWAMTFNGPGGTYTQQDALTNNRATPGSMTFTAGTYNTGNQTINITGTGGGSITVAGGTVNFGTSTINCGTQNSNSFTYTSGTMDASTAVFVISIASTTARTFAGGAQSYGTLRYTVADSPAALIISGGNTFGTLEIGPEHRVQLPALSNTTVTTLTISGRFNGYQRLSANAGSVTLPDSAALSLTGDMDLRVYVALDDWSPATVSALIAKRSGANANTASYQLSVGTTGVLSLLIATGAANTTANSNVALSFTDGTAHWVRATRRASDGRVQFFTSNDPASTTSPTWTQLGVDQTNASVGQDTTDVVTFGGYTATASNTISLPSTGKLYRAQIRNNVLDNGTGIQADVDFTQATNFGQNTFVEGSSNAATVTIFDLAQLGDGRTHVISTASGSLLAGLIHTGGGIVSEDYMRLGDSDAKNPTTWYAGSHSVDMGTNSNWNFTDPPAANTADDMFLVMA